MYMLRLIWKEVLRKSRRLAKQDGQDLIEYALLVALIALAATAGMTSLATGINTAFSNISTQLAAAI
jgi:pilus assembly protein Flp/PilA